MKRRPTHGSLFPNLYMTPISQGRAVGERLRRTGERIRTGDR
jgi:hypothetical protein